MKLFTICILFSKFFFTLSAIANSHLLVTRIGPCDSISNTIVTVSEMGLANKVQGSSLSGTFNISEEIVDGWKLKATMQKCKDIRNMDTCDYFRSIPVVKEGCVETDDVEKEKPYSMFFNHVTPSISCPLQAGQYSIKDYSFFTEDGGSLSAAESKISTSVFGYTFRLEGFSDEKRILCVDAHLRLLYVREHDWLASHNSNQVTTTEDPGQRDEDIEA